MNKKGGEVIHFILKMGLRCGFENDRPSLRYKSSGELPNAVFTCSGMIPLLANERFRCNAYNQRNSGKRTQANEAQTNGFMRPGIEPTII
jgi:hypothetical protein